MLIRIGRPKTKTKVVGVALSGGGVRGLAHIGVLKALLDHNIPIDMIAGTSAGSIVASLYACGYTPRQMVNLAEKLDLSNLIDLNVTVTDLIKHSMKWFFSGKFRFWSVLPTGLIQGDKLERFFSGLWQDRTVHDTKIPLAVTAVDINSASTVFFTTPIPGHRTILNARYYHNVLLTDAVRSSISIPGIFLPKKFRGMTLVDGAVKNNLPTDILHHMGADFIIAVDLGYAGQANYDLKSVGEILLQCIDIMGREVTLLKGEQYADVIIRPDMQGISFKSTKQALLGIKRGEEAAQTQIAEIKKLLSD
ncbi:patatin-like phospholipase family protein [Propionispora vibrioides]|uniref:NTE family protein n=1 Tax=Propionispora vibrioides TaxID=112903 RepID=A0A1H8NJ70_9FIRM|nr:patatin-like phospholipase family protein [Propionispora vibrioides]SEO29612.1 NTE family protein [Propionispora vibrioides]